MACRECHLAQNENGEQKQKLHEMEGTMDINEAMINGIVERFGPVEATMREVAGQMQQQNIFNQSASTTMNRLVEVTKHQGHF